MDTQVIAHYRPLAALMPSTWQQGYITLASQTRMHYLRTGGPKTPVILLHGFQSAGIMWLRTARALVDYDVIMPDFRGHGLSSSVDSGFSASLLVEDIATLIRTLKVDKAFITGHSMGGEIAGRLAATYPDTVRALVLVDPPLRPFNLPPVDLDQPPAWMLPVLNALRSIKTQPHEQRLMTMQQLIPPTVSTWHEVDYVSAVEAAVQFDVQTLNARVDYQLATADMIRRIACPILLMTAGQTAEHDVHALTDSWQSGKHVSFPDSGHFIPFDQFERFLDVLTHFFRNS